MKSRALIIAVVLTMAPAFAQEQGAISGVVRDTSGRVLPGVTVEVVGGIGANLRSLVTDAQGRYSVSDLPVGAYTLTFRLSGFTPETRSKVAVTGILSTPLDVVLRVAMLEQGYPMPPSRVFPPESRADPGGQCLHGENETAAERERRLEALNAARMIYTLLARVPTRLHRYPEWGTLGLSPAVAALKKAGGATGELANKLQWGTNEPLPGWGIAYETGIGFVRFALIDITDPCGFKYSSEDPTLMPGTSRIVPLVPQ